MTLKSAARGGMVLASSATLCLSMTACGGKSHKAASSAKASASSATSMKGSPASSSTGGKSSKSHSGSGCITAKIGGVSKCIKPGQMCSHKHASDYKSYGMSCDKKGNEYILSKKS